MNKTLNGSLCHGVGRTVFRSLQNRNHEWCVFSEPTDNQFRMFKICPTTPCLPLGIFCCQTVTVKSPALLHVQAFLFHTNTHKINSVKPVFSCLTVTPINLIWSHCGGNALLGNTAHYKECRSDLNNKLAASCTKSRVRSWYLHPHKQNN